MPNHRGVGDEVGQAGSLLREIATALAKLPLDERASPLHLRVLALRRVVSDWAQTPPSAAHVESVLESLRVLQVHVAAIRPTSGVLLRSTEPGSVRKAKGR
jgi:hypothetical protein